MDPVAERLSSIAGLAGRIYGAAKLSQLMASNQLAQVTPAGFVLPLGLVGGRVDAATGMFRQGIERLTGVLLVVRAAGDATGAAALMTLEPLIDAVIGRMCGWSPDSNAVGGDYRLARGELLGLATGTLTYQLDFAIEDQLRITT